MTNDISFQRIRRWGAKGLLSVVDQGIFSGANFLVSIVLARWLLPSEYGIYAVAFAVYQVAYQLQGSLVIEPMSVLGPATMREYLSEYIHSQIKVHFILSLALSVFILLASLIIFQFDRRLSSGLTSLGLALGFMLLPWLLRRSFYVLGKPEISLLGSIFYALTLLSTLCLFYFMKRLSVELAFISFAIGGIGSGILMTPQISNRQGIRLSVFDTIVSNWQYGQWLILSAILIAIAAQIQAFVVGLILDLSSAGAYRALQNIVQPVILSFSALTAVALPSFSHEFGQKNYDELWKKGKILLFLLFLIALLFEILLISFRYDIEYLFYKGRYKAYGELIPLWGLVPFAGVLTFGYYFLLQAMQKSKAILWGSAVWMSVSCLLSLILTASGGLKGAVISNIVGYSAGGIMFAVLFHHYFKRIQYSTLKQDNIY